MADFEANGSSIVFEHLRKRFKGIDDIAFGCVYFNYNTTASPKDIIANVLKQLVQQSPVLSTDVETLYSSHSRNQTYPNMKEFSRLLETEAGRVSSFFIVIDALDECTGGQQSGVDILLELQKIPNTRLMITGRPYVEDAVLSKCKDSTKLMIRASDCDIRKTIESYIDQSVYLSKVTETNPSLRETIIESLVTKSKGMYSTVI
jgi:Cdc6-like AAA superfamily ATPase